MFADINFFLENSLTSTFIKYFRILLKSVLTRSCFTISDESLTLQISKFLKSISNINYQFYKTLLKKFYRIGGAKEDRTPDLLRARQALSQLSYGPCMSIRYFYPCSTIHLI